MSVQNIQNGGTNDENGPRDVPLVQAQEFVHGQDVPHARDAEVRTLFANQDAEVQIKTVNKMADSWIRYLCPRCGEYYYRDNSAQLAWMMGTGTLGVGYKPFKTVKSICGACK